MSLRSSHPRETTLAVVILFMLGMPWNPVHCFQQHQHRHPVDMKITSPLRWRFSVSQDYTRISHDQTKLCSSSKSEQSAIFVALSSSRESDYKPGNCNFFYNDEVSSHLHGYMLLVSLFAAQDQIFLGSFVVLASLAAAVTLAKKLPANPRVPALVAVMTMMTTIVLEPFLVPNYLPPPSVDSARIFEIVIVALNIGWGFFGSWQTKEQVNGATFGM
jgi:hypothetical protein